MKQSKFLFIIFLIATPLILTSSNSNQQESATKTDQQSTQMANPEKYDPTPAVLNNFAHIIGNFVNIVQDPENSTNVGTNIANMFGNIINIALEATRSGKLSINATPEDIANYVNSLGDEFKNELAKMVMKKTKKLRSAPTA